MKYKWIRNPMGGLEAQVVGDELDRLEKKVGSLTAETVVKAATPKRSVLHGCFEWDNEKAAHEHRLSQARYILRSIEVVFEEDPEQENSRTIEIRAFHHVEKDDGERAYVTLNQARNNENYWQQVKDKALSEIRAWQNKYRAINEFEVIFDAIAQIS